MYYTWFIYLLYTNIMTTVIENIILLLMHLSFELLSSLDL